MDSYSFRLLINVCRRVHNYSWHFVDVKKCMFLVPPGSENKHGVVFGDSSGGEFEDCNSYILEKELWSREWEDSSEVNVLEYEVKNKVYFKEIYWPSTDREMNRYSFMDSSIVYSEAVNNKNIFRCKRYFVRYWMSDSYKFL